MFVASVYLIYIFAQLLIKQYVIVDFDVFVSCKYLAALFVLCSICYVYYLAHCMFCDLFVVLYLVHCM